MRIHPWAAAITGLALLTAGVLWVGLEETATALSRQQPARMLTAVAAIAFSTLLGAWNCFRIAELGESMRFRAFLVIFWRAWALGLSVPGQVGDLLSTLWQLRGRVDLTFVAGRLLTDKAVTLACMLVLCASLPAVLGLLDPRGARLLPLGAACVIALGAEMVLRLSRRGSALQAPPRSRLGPLLAAANVPRRKLAVNVLVTCLKILATGVAYLMLLAPEPGSIGFLAVVAISHSAGLVAYLPVSFNGIGTVELSAVPLYGEAGLDAAQVLSAYLVIRLCTLATAWLPVTLLSLRAATVAAIRTDDPP